MVSQGCCYRWPRTSGECLGGESLGLTPFSSTETPSGSVLWTGFTGKDSSVKKGSAKNKASRVNDKSPFSSEWLPLGPRECVRTLQLFFFPTTDFKMQKIHP